MISSSIDLLSRLVAFDTTSSRSNLELVEWVANYLDGFGVPTHLTFSDDRTKANLFATIGSQAEAGICLHGHTDVVPVNGQIWQTDPFLLTETDGRLFGRGAADMKTWIACSLAAVPQFRERKLKTPIHIALSYDEEVGCLGVPRIIAQFGTKVPKPTVVFVGEPSMMQPITAHKGVLALDTKITGRAAHSSLLHLGVSAATAAADFALEVQHIAKDWADLPGPHGMRPPGPSANVGHLCAGVARNMIPSEALVRWEIRFRAEDEPSRLLESVLERVQQRLGRSFKDKFGALGISTEVVSQSPAFDSGSRAVAEHLARRFGAVGPAIAVSYGTEAGRYAEAGIPTVICGPGSIEQAHQPNEFITASQVTACDRFLGRLGEWAATELPPLEPSHWCNQN